MTGTHQPRTLSTDIVSRIRRDIMAGELPFGSRLTLAGLEARYRSGQMPIREALRQLQGEGLVELAPNRGARVRSVDAAFVRNLFDLRVAIEATLARRAAEAVEPRHLVDLEAAAAAFERSSPGDVIGALEANRAFHGVINALASNDEASLILRRHEQLMTALWLRHGYGADQIASSAADHRHIIEALRARDAEAAAYLAMAHASKAKLELLRRLGATA